MSDHARELATQGWDVIVVGTGMGGATLGYALARAGRKVLFLEKGRALLHRAQGRRGAYAEVFLSAHGRWDSREDVLRETGRTGEQLCDASNKSLKCFTPLLGCGSGGSTALYGATLERFRPEDFTPKRFHADTTQSTLPDSWPIRYSELAPYYTAAERLFGVRTLDDVSNPAAELMDFLRNKNLRPHKLPLAFQGIDGCSGCPGYLCDKDCKNDATKICLRPALDDHGATLLGDCVVLRLLSTGNRITGVVCCHQGEVCTLRSRLVVLAAGALATPRILLSSTSESWPTGLANKSGLVGKNLMRHLVDLYIVDTHARVEADTNLKNFSVNDFYVYGGKKFGTLQSFGPLPPLPVILHQLRSELQADRGISRAALFKLLAPLVRLFVNRKLSRGLVLASIIEDLPYEHNRVEISPQKTSTDERRIVLKYRLGSQDQARIKQFRNILRDVLRPYKFRLLKQAESNANLSHACGTCRFGKDPRSSVLDPDNRAHGLRNLYIVDSSFFPSSGGTNPSLTIAANALRVGDAILSNGHTLAEDERL